MAQISDSVLDDGPAAFVDRVGARRWRTRLAELRAGCTPGHAGRALGQHHCIEFALDRLRAGSQGRSVAERQLASLAATLASLAGKLTAAGRVRLDAALDAALTGDGTLVALMHLARSARVQEERGFAVHHAGLEEDAAYDLLLARDGQEAELACEVISAENGRDVHRGAWVRLVDRIDPDLQQWLSAHPGRYLLKMTLPHGLRRDGDAPRDAESLGRLHDRITRLLTEHRRADHDEAAVLRLDPLLLAAAEADALSLMPRLRREFGPEAHLAVTASGGGVFVMAARAGREDEVAAAMHRRMAAIAPLRLTGTRPGILAMFIEDTDRLEWRTLREQLSLEGESRQFMTRPEASSVVAVTCASRFELLGCAPPDGVEGGELRFRNPRHPAAAAAALAPSVLSSH